MKNTIIYILLGVVAVGVIGYGLSNKKTETIPLAQNVESSASVDKIPDSSLVDSKEAMIPGETLEKDFLSTQTNEVISVAGTYDTYTETKVAQATGKVVLFFNASWCPTCRRADKDIKENASQIPADVHIFSVNYDTNKDLRKKYGVTSQHTFVQIDKEGNQVVSWKGGDLSTIISNLK